MKNSSEQSGEPATSFHIALSPEWNLSQNGGRWVHLPRTYPSAKSIRECRPHSYGINVTFLTNKLTFHFLFPTKLLMQLILVTNSADSNDYILIKLKTEKILIDWTPFSLMCTVLDFFCVKCAFVSSLYLREWKLRSPSWQMKTSESWLEVVLERTLKRGQVWQKYLSNWSQLTSNDMKRNTLDIRMGQWYFGKDLMGTF